MYSKTSADGVYQTVVLAGLAVVNGPVNEAITAPGASADSVMDALHKVGFHPGDKERQIRQVVGTLINRHALLKALAIDFEPLDDPRYGGVGHPPLRAKVIFSAARGLEDAANLHSEALVHADVIAVR